MAWASKKQYAILMGSEEGKDLAEKLPDMEQEEFNDAFAELLGKGGSTSASGTKDNKEQATSETKYKVSHDTDYDEKDNRYRDIVNVTKTNEDGTEENFSDYGVSYGNSPRYFGDFNDIYKSAMKKAGIDEQTIDSVLNNAKSLQDVNSGLENTKNNKEKTNIFKNYIKNNASAWGLDEDDEEEIAQASSQFESIVKNLQRGGTTRDDSEMADFVMNYAEQTGTSIDEIENDIASDGASETLNKMNDFMGYEEKGNNTSSQLKGLKSKFSHRLLDDSIDNLINKYDNFVSKNDDYKDMFLEYDVKPLIASLEKDNGDYEDNYFKDMQTKGKGLAQELRKIFNIK